MATARLPELDFEAMTAEDVLRWAAAEFGDKLCLTCSWQRQSSVLIHMLSELDILDLNWSTLRGEVSSMAPTAWFVGQVSEYGVQLSDFGRDEAEEVILLTRNAREFTPWWAQSAEICEGGMPHSFSV